MADNMLYRMDRKKMGRAVIINNLDEEQTPTKKDVEAMGSILKVIGFDVKIYKNLSSEQMNSVKRDFTDPAVHRDSNCFLLCVISHGTEDNFLQDKHGAKTWNIESLVTEVSDISTLGGKPKLFFIEARRGKYRNVSQEMAKSSSNPYPLHGISLPSKQDVFVGFATVPGFVAFTASNGSPYIQALAEVLADHHHDLDLVDIHLLVRRKMTNYVTPSEDRQGAEERTSLLSKLKFSEYKIASTALFSSLAVSRPVTPPVRRLSPPPPDGVPTYPETITVSGAGPGAVRHAASMGVFRKEEGAGRNGRPVWRKVNSQLERFLFYSGARWVIGPNPQENGGWIQSNKDHLISIPTSGWQYYDGKDWQDDPQLVFV